MQLLVRGGDVAGPSSVPRFVERFSNEAVEPVTVERPVLPLVRGGDRWLTVSTADVLAAG